jgi:predicted O-methyltransferase YrrM
VTTANTTTAKLDLFEIIETVLSEGAVLLPDGRRKRITGGISMREALDLASLIEENGVRRTVETGVAFGVSTLAICAALKNTGAMGVLHVGIDPDQHSQHEGAALAQLERFGLTSSFRLMEGPAHLMAPKLIEEGFSADLAFIDGLHNFDYTLVDFFLLDKILRPRGLLAIHDMDMPSKKKVVRFILANRHYEMLPYRPRSLGRTGRELLRCIKHGDRMVGPVLRRMPRMVVLRKIDCWEPEWHYFRPF